MYSEYSYCLLLYTVVMTYDIGTHVTFTINKKPPYVHVSIKPGISRTYTVGSKVILNQLITQVSEVFAVPVRITA